MQNKLKILLSIVFILGAIIAWQRYSAQLVRPVSPYGEKTRSFSGKPVDKIVLTKDGKALNFTREKDAWKLDGKKADKAKIDDLLGALLPTGSPDLIAKTSAKHQDFALNASASAEVKLNDSVSILLGKAAPSGGIYARFPDSPNVYILGYNGVSDLMVNPANWWDKTIYMTDKTKLQKIAFVSKDKNITLVKEKDEWKDQSGKNTPSKEKLDEFLGSISSISADSIPPEDQLKEYPMDPEYSLTLNTDTGGETLSFHPGKTEVLANRQSDGQKFLISASTAAKVSDFFKSI